MDFKNHEHSTMTVVWHVPLLSASKEDLFFTCYEVAGGERKLNNARAALGVAHLNAS